MQQNLNRNRLLEIKKGLFKQKEYDILDIWNYLMLNYGWIPFEEFKKLDAEIVNELVERLNELNKKNKGLRRFR